jgi:hypothetical protein
MASIRSDSAIANGLWFVIAFAIAVILNAVKDPEELHPPQPPGPFNPYSSALPLVPSAILGFAKKPPIYLLSPGFSPQSLKLVEKI